MPPGVVAAGHPKTAEAGAAVLRAGGNAVDAALGAMLMSFVAEPLLTGLGAGGYLLVAGFDDEPAVLDFFVAAPGEGGDGAIRGDLVPINVSFGDAEQVFNVGAPSAGVWGAPAGVCDAARRWGTVPLEELVRDPARAARSGIALNRQQAYITDILGAILVSSPEGEALFAPGGVLLREGDTFAWPDLADALERLARDGAAPFYTGDVGRAVADHLGDRGGMITHEDLERYGAVPRKPVAVGYRGRRVLTNPPPNAGGILIAEALARLNRGTPSTANLVEVMADVQAGRTQAFVSGLDEPGFAERHLANRLGATTHISVLDRDGRAASVTCTNGEGCGIPVPGTGVHPNNIMGEADLNPFGFHAFPPRRRMPSMMAPTMVIGGGGVDLVLGSAGSNRIRSAILQTIVGVVDRGEPVARAIDAPRVHFEDGTVYAEPGVDVDAIAQAGHDVVAFREPNVFFGGVQAVQRFDGAAIVGAGDPRRGGVAVTE